MRKVIAIAVAAACAFVLASCAPSPQSKDGAAEAEVNVEEVAPVEDETQWVLTKSVEEEGNGYKTVKEYEYAEEGKVVEETKLSYDQGGERFSKTIDLKRYDDAGNVVEQTISDINESNEVTKELNDKKEYDEDGNPISRHITERKGGEVEETIIEAEFDSHGNTTREDITLLRDGSEEDRYALINEREYDDEGNLTRAQQLDERDGSTHVDTYEYDDENRVIREEHAGQSESIYIDTTQEYAYDDHGEKTWEHLLNLYDGEVQSETETNYLNAYEDDQKLCSIIDPETGAGWYYAYDDAGHRIQEVSLTEEGVGSNKLSIYDSNGLLLMEVSSSTSQGVPNVTTYDYENLKTGQKVSGALYNREKYYSTFSVEYPTTNQIIMDAQSIYAKAVGDEGVTASLSYDQPETLDYLVFDPSISTDPTKVDIRRSDMGTHISADWYELDLPAAWDGMVEFNVMGPVTEVFLAGHYECNLYTIMTSETETLEAGDIGTPLLYKEAAPQCPWVEVRATNWVYHAALYYASQNGSIPVEEPNIYLPINAVSEEHAEALLALMVDLSTGGAVSLNDIRGDPEAYLDNTYIQDFFESVVAPSIVIRPAEGVSLEGSVQSS